MYPLTTTPPKDYTNAGTMMIISGAFNVMTSGAILLALLFSVIGLCVAPIWVLTFAGGIMEIIIGAQISGGRPSSMGLSTAVVGLISAVCCGNMLGMILEILAMVSLGKPEVKMWLADPTRPAIEPPGGRPGPQRPPPHRPPERREPPPAPEPEPARAQPPADFRPRTRRRAGPSVSWTGDLPLEQK